MPCPVTGEKHCHCRCPNMLAHIAQKHDTTLEDSSDANKTHFDCMKSELSCDFTQQQFEDAHQLCIDQGKPFHSALLS
jgi:hypothetical protein